MPSGPLYLTAGVGGRATSRPGKPALLAALDRQWADLVGHKLYVTGGVGSRHLGEAFGQPYELPNDLAYCETCAAIGSILWSWRMLLATGQARFADLIDRTLHNAVLAGVSLDGERYFYVNPLASNGRPEHLGRGGCRRKEWHLVACCPPNVMRLLASLGHYVATRDATGLQVHQYAPARIATRAAGRPRRDPPDGDPVPVGGVGPAQDRGSGWEPLGARPARARVVPPRHRPGERRRRRGRARRRRLPPARSELARRRRRRAGPPDGAAADRAAPGDRVDARMRGDRARAPRLLPRAGRSG